MLSVYLGKMDEAVYYPPVYFDNRYEDEWITDKRSVEIIGDVDKSDVVSAHLPGARHLVLNCKRKMNKM